MSLRHYNMYKHFEELGDIEDNSVGDLAGTDRGDEGQVKRKKKAEALFKRFDTDKDGHLTHEELHSHDVVLNKIHPTHEEQAHQRAEDTVYHVDTDNDKKLSKEEMMQYFYMFQDVVSMHGHGEEL